MRKPYKRTAEKMPPVVFDVELSNGTATITAKHLCWHEVNGLEQSLIGVVPEKADVTGQLELKRRIKKLGAVTTAIDTGSEEGNAEVGTDFAAYYALPGNEDLAFVGWATYYSALAGVTPKSSSEDSGASDGEGRGEAQSA